MNGLGSGDYGQFTFLDTISLLSFFIAIMNLNENLTQGDKQELQKDLAEKTDNLLKEVHEHLEDQDKKIDRILEELSK